MRVALIRKRFDPFGGGERYLAGLVSRVREAGVKVHLIASTWPENARDAGVTLHRMRCPKKPPSLYAWTFAKGAAGLMERERFDLAHSFERTFGQQIHRAGDGIHAEFLDAYARFLGPGPGLVKRLAPLSMVYNSIERRLYSHPELRLVIANSKRGKAEIVSRFGLARDMVEVIYNGVDAEMFAPDPGARSRVRDRLGLSDDAPVFLFVGSGFRRKGLHFAIQALAGLKEGVLIAAGKGKRVFFEGLAERLGMRERVHILGPVAEIESLYSAADVFVLPSVYEPFANVCLEAAAAMLPVVTTEQNGASEIVEPGVNGFVISDPRAARELAGMMERSLTLDKERLAEHNSRLLRSHTWDGHISRVLAAYSKVSGEKIGL
jgi:UDP-glucose:(heptosyl)LPS alpha-1,3-glucosyltransferase